MAEFNKVLWSLDNEISARDFERLCVDLLCREGFRHINPIGGTKDQGRDAEYRAWKGENTQSEVVAFQFSMQERWIAKFKKDAAKVAKNCRDAVEFVFVSSREISGEAQTKLRKEYEVKCCWRLTFFGREWLRHRLCEFHPDLAMKYSLATDLPVTLPSCLSQIDLVESEEEMRALDFGENGPEMLRASIVAVTRKEPFEPQNWYRLVKFENWQGNLTAALDAIRIAKPLVDTDSLVGINLRLFEAGILADLGIKNSSRPMLLQAVPVLEWAAQKLKRAVDFYNLGNVYGALGRVPDAEKSYSNAIELDDSDPRTWVNLASLRLKNGDQSGGVHALERALAINPNHMEALLTIASTSLLFLDKVEDSIRYFGNAERLSPDIDRFPHFRYWYAVALHRRGDDAGALQQLEQGLAVHPGDKHLLDAKAGTLSKLRKSSALHEETALQFMLFRIEAFPEDFGSLAEIVDIYIRRKEEEKAWAVISGNLAPVGYNLRAIVEKANFSLADLKFAFEQETLYHQYRECARIFDLVGWMWSAGLKPKETMIQALEYALMPLFGRLLRKMSAGAENMNHDNHIALFKESLTAIATILPAFGSWWLASEKPSEQAVCIDMISRGGLALIDVATMELARLYGYLVAHHQILVDVVELGKDIDWSEVGSGLAVDPMVQALGDWDMQTEKS